MSAADNETTLEINATRIGNSKILILLVPNLIDFFHYTLIFWIVIPKGPSLEHELIKFCLCVRNLNNKNIAIKKIRSKFFKNQK